MGLPTEPIGSIPRPQALLAGIADHAAGRIGRDALDALYDDAVRDTIATFEALGSPVVTDGEQSKPSFATYPLQGLDALAPGGAVIPFADGHTRQLPRLTAGPFRYAARSEGYLRAAQRHATVPVKQAVIAPSALSLLYPQDGIEGYDRAAFLDDLVDEAEADVRGALDAGAHIVQMDFTEGRLPSLFALNAGVFYVQLASEPDPDRALAAIAAHVRPHQRVFVGVIDPIDPVVETAEQVRDRVLRAAGHISPDRLGTCDDCGFAPFGDDVSTSRDTAWAKVRARIEGTALAADQLGV